MSGYRVEWRGKAAFEEMADVLGIESDRIAAVIPRGGHDEPELWHVFFTTPELEDGDALDVLLGPSSEHATRLEPKCSRRLLVGFFDELYRQLDDLSPPGGGDFS